MIKLRGLVAKKFKRTNQTELQSVPDALQLIDGQLWCGQGYRIHIYSPNLQKQRAIAIEDIEFVNGIAEVDDDKVAVATDVGLVLIDKQGNASDSVSLSITFHTELRICLKYRILISINQNISIIYF